ncbi:MAG: glycoside hydrolase family 3 C-terminal domain-containing protein, partial [Candidatus Cryptobacteroides sp.]
EHGEVALRAARESVVLLENNGILPLSKDVKVAVIGPNADRAYNQLGDYTAPQPEENIITPLEGICEKIGPENVKYVRGCGIRDTQTQNIRQAVKAAAQSDVILAFVGGSSARDFGTQYKDTGAAVADASSISDMEAGEGFDRASLDLLGLQPELLKALKKTGKPLVVVYIEGRPLDKTWAKDNADALLTQFYPGQAGGQAIADVLFGDYNPAGRLPISVPRSVGQLPVYYNKLNPAGHDYVEMSAAPLYSFGYGLSYTTFSYDNMTCEILPDGKVKVSVEISNTGSRGGEEVVQLYVSDLVASVVRPRKQLRAFERVYIEAGASRTVEMILDADAFSLYNAEMEYLLEEGEFLVGAGPSSDNILLSQTIAL